MEADGDMTKDEARERIYGMPFADWKSRYQGEATPQQIEAMKNSVAKNA